MKKVSNLQTAQSYAQALYEAAKEENMLEEARQDCENLAKTFAHVPQLKLLSNPGWNKAQKKDLIAHISSALNLSAPTANFLELVALNGRIGMLSRILDQFKHIYFKQQDILEVTVESVKAFSANQDKKLLTGLEKLLKQRVVLNYKINPQILGGVIIQYESVRIDDSVAGKLKRLGDVMKGNV